MKPEERRERRKVRYLEGEVREEASSEAGEMWLELCGQWAGGGGAGGQVRTAGRWAELTEGEKRKLTGRESMTSRGEGSRVDRSR